MKKYSFVSTRNASFLTSSLFIRLLCLFVGVLTLILYLRFKFNNTPTEVTVVDFGDSEKKELNEVEKEIANFFDKSKANEEPELPESSERNFVNNPLSFFISPPKSPAVLKNELKNPLNPMNLNQPLPKPKMCVGDVEKFLAKVRRTQQNAVNYWNEMSVNDRLKWTALTSMYEPGLINFKLLFHFVTDGENKYFLDFVQRDHPDCNIITMGVGLDYSGETKLWNRYPQCKMTAVDPMSDVNKQIVERVPNSRFIEATIGAHDGNYTARLRQLNMKYETVTVQHVGITNFLRQINGDKLIDLLIMDIEGSEFGVLPTLIEEKHMLPTICQLNVELHYSPESYGYKSADALNGLYKFFSDGTYSIMNMEVFRRLLRVYAVNTQDPRCIQKFFC